MSTKHAIAWCKSFRKDRCHLAGTAAHVGTCRRWQGPARALTPDAASAAPDSAPVVDEKSDEYSKTMQKRMGTSLTYNHEAGLDFNRVLPDLIVGSCLQTAADVDRLAEEEGVKVVYCLQGECKERLGSYQKAFCDS